MRNLNSLREQHERVRLDELHYRRQLRLEKRRWRRRLRLLGETIGDLVYFTLLAALLFVGLALIAVLL